MFIVNSLLNLKKEKNLLNQEIDEIRKGNSIARNRFISNYKPFVAKTVSKIINRYVDVNNSDEFSIGLFAFNSAIDSYNSDRGNFIKYAELVIRSKVIDHLRKGRKKEIPFSEFEVEGEVNLIFNKEDCKSRVGFDNIESEDGIKEFKTNLYQYNITLDELVSNSPKHKDSVVNCINIAKIVIEKDCMFDEFKKSKCLPIRKILKYTKLHRRTIERNRKFIIALILILKSDLNIIKTYLAYTERAGEKK